MAPSLLGCWVVTDRPEGQVALRLTEVEAYSGEGEDPASHAHRGPTPRAAIMFGPPGRLYVYFSYGVHWCANVVVGPEGRGSAVLLRAGEVVVGEPLARSRRPAARAARDLARGPARLTQALGIGPDDKDADLLDPASPVRLHRGTAPAAGLRRATGRHQPGAAAAVAVLADGRAVGERVPGGRDGERVEHGARHRAGWIPVTDLIDELHRRGLIALSTDEAALRAHLAEGPVTYYCGFDPTAPSLHVGNLVQFMLLRALQRAGHQPVVLVGGATGLIGDPGAGTPSGSSTTARSSPSGSRASAATSSPFSSGRPRDGLRPPIYVDNLDWTEQLSAIDFLRAIGKNFRVSQMLAKEAVSARLNSEAGISYTEFSYQILQANDYRELYRRHGVTLQTGGSDQWGNLTAGIDLVRRTEGAGVHAMGTPLITTADGQKIGKTQGATVWLDPG